MGEIRIERIYESVKANNTYRVLVDRLWPRGISKEKAAIDEWWKDTAPSPELRKWFNHEPAKYAEFKAYYLEELAQNEYAAGCKNRVGTLLKERDVILLYAAKDVENNHALVFKKWLETVAE